MKRPISGLYINTSEAQCSIFESGRMMYDCLRRSDAYRIDYREINAADRTLSGHYDFYAFNYHPLVMQWLDVKSLRRLRAPKIAFVLEVAPNDPFVMCPRDVFDAYCPLDPTIELPDPRVFAFPRPLEDTRLDEPHLEPEVPTIGTFGFATTGKGYDLVVKAVGEEFDRAVVKLNIPPGTYADDAYRKAYGFDYAEKLIEECRLAAKPGIELRVTREFMSKQELIAWCRRNTLNCFLYTRNIPGLSATTDQAVTSGRPLAVSDNSTFRHLHRYLTPYPARSLRESISQSVPEIQRMQQDWKPECFASRFEEVLSTLRVDAPRSDRDSGEVSLDIVRPTSHFRKEVRSLLARAKGRLRPTRMLKLFRGA